ncbi:adenosylmethionine-8-amino-7-oxononanoate aminotransferase [Acrocarpospora pleiomorpha]|uniref:Adenosylmethionine-8-amino-7-oxononanoate aminotransferase n=1 Tax=Acrocarpospora pleiomorpha TaxID=90975 RepID=A0A5M3Y1J8_9ACTN|nr:aminotransferase class III-fold pyridoxal phosphate-dependent enzyme [Acrocarpospora pleiomorpha]GES27076.1 adenosylmethionine-8-amino-7-oxononanoate aminotransferase [Acrocarpospora pleiomorpha]
MARPFPTAVAEPAKITRADGVYLWDEAGRRYMDASGGAIAISLGHNDPEIRQALVDQQRAVAYANRTVFTSQSLEDYAAELGPILPMEDPYVFTVSGGSEGVETAFKMARAYHVARGEDSRHKILARGGEYHGATRGGLDATDRPAYDRIYRPWLGQTVKLPRYFEYRCQAPNHPDGCDDFHIAALEEAIAREGANTIAAFVFEPVTGATTGVTHATERYWRAAQEICRRHGILMIADEVMCGHGRTGRWFASDHWGLRPDLLVAGKAASSAYWPLGFTAVSGPVGQVIADSGIFVHGFTYSQNAVGAAVGLAVLRKMKRLDLVTASAVKGKFFADQLQAAMGDHPNVGDIRVKGLFGGVELVADRDTKAPFARSERTVERVQARALAHGLYSYTSVGLADGDNGDLLLLGPAYVSTEEELSQMAALLALAIEGELPN